ncbi:MAG: AraC family transcriptional regulator [Dechloromonas sp.]|uniref:AraC family transcriptional regulator n=1 Tax=Candidatus Dechloromonas phosphorivorans TaxID=2899244 RepID=A0A9D7LLL1_9RHOO|nr:AraC family transcriptional regulator [Candidatus Dechloromonas phosphorivorans]
MPPRIIRSPTTRTQATVAMGFVNGLLAGLARQGIDAAPLLAATGIDIADTASRVPVDHYAALYNQINRRLDDEGFGLFCQPMRLGSFEFLCRSCISSQTLAEALARAGRFLRIVLPDLTVTVLRQQDRAELVIGESRRLADNPDDPGRVFAFEWLLRLLHALACWLAGRGIALDNVTFPYRKPTHFADYALIFTEDSRFAPTLAGGVGTLVATFSANLLDLPIRRDEAALSAFLDGAPGKITTLYRRDREMLIRVRDLLRAALPATLSLKDIGDRLHQSPRTIHRRLGEEGTSFRAIKDALRRDIALTRLTKTHDSIAKVAADLGYADTSAFYRAFVEWTGMAPVRYRRRCAEGT